MLIKAKSHAPLLFAVMVSLIVIPAQAFAAPCVAPDNGGGTVTLPAPCPYATLAQGPMMIVDGLPPGSAMEMDAVLTNFTCLHSGRLCSLLLSPGQCEMAGGSLGGHGHCFEADLQLAVTGTGSLGGSTGI